MNISDHAREWLEEAYRNMFDDEWIEQNRHKHEREQRIADKKLDSGYIE